jgi:hypothetical protein
MRYRQLSPTGDFTMGLPPLTNTPAAVGQAALTRLRLWKGEWFVDTSDGTPYRSQILGERAGKNPDVAIKQRILGTVGVTGITAYSSSFNRTTRRMSVTATLQTLYGEITISTTL